MTSEKPDLTNLMASLTHDQRRDVRTYMREGELPMVEAIARVLAPRRRVTCIPPDMRAHTREPRP